MIYEIRDYHYRPDIFDAYRAWAEEAVAVLKSKMDVVGFWIDTGEFEPGVAGSNPQKTENGWANVTWIIRWESREVREKEFNAAIESDEWKAVWAKHPDANGYRQMVWRFMEAM